MFAARLIAVAIFVVMFVMIIMEKFEKQYITLTAGLATIVGVFGIGGLLAGDAMDSMSALIDTLNVKSIFTRDFWYAAS